MLTPKEAFLEVAQRFRETEPLCGICCEIEQMFVWNIIDRDTRTLLHRAIDKYRADNLITTTYFWQIKDWSGNSDNNVLRAELCEQLAKEFE